MTATSRVLELTHRLIERPSVTPEDGGCQELLGGVLERSGFHLERLPFGEVENLWARAGDSGPLFVFAGHTDVVPTGDVNAWHSDPFTPTLRDGYLYGRGSADMKGSLAAMIVATERFLAAHPGRGRIAFLLTSDEEGVAVDGTVKVVQWLRERNIVPDYCVVGEPSSTARLGDVIRIGRRGSLNGRLIVHGVQGHVAYPELVRNPVHEALPALSALVAERWDDGNAAFPPTTLQISNMAAGTGASNVVPGTLRVDFNLRFSTEQTSSGLMRRLEQLIAATGAEHELQWALSGEPFLPPQGRLLTATRRVIRELQGFETECSTAGGTSDGRFIAPLGCELLELGPVNETIHQIDERVAVADLELLEQMYYRILERVLVDDDA